MPRKGQMSDQDAADEVVRNNATHYNVVLHQAQRNSRVYFTHSDLDTVIDFAENVYQDPNIPGVRSAMIYAIDADDHFALMGTTNRFKNEFKPNVVKIH